MSAVQLVVVVALTTCDLLVAFSYTTGPQRNELSGIHTRSHLASSNDKASQKVKAAKYDLGLGKNPPVLNNNNNQNKPTKSAFGDIEDDVYRASQHWNDHQAVRSIPSPLDPETYGTHNTGGQHSHLSLSVKSTHTIQYNRQSEDVLFIYEPSSNSSRENTQKKPTMVANTQGAQLDMNTPWVEMLLHSEQSKAAVKRKR